jgi:hypothetical protein
MLAEETFLMTASRLSLTKKMEWAYERRDWLAGEDAAQSDGTTVQCRNIKSSINLKCINHYRSHLLSHTWIDHDRTSLMIADNTFPTLGMSTFARCASLRLSHRPLKIEPQASILFYPMPSQRRTPVKPDYHLGTRQSAILSFDSLTRWLVADLISTLEFCHVSPGVPVRQIIMVIVSIVSSARGV